MAVATTQYGVYSSRSAAQGHGLPAGLAHMRLTPDNCHDLLFDDVIWVHEAQAEHYSFCQMMRERGSRCWRCTTSGDDAGGRAGPRLGARPQDQSQYGGAAGPGRASRLAGRDAAAEARRAPHRRYRQQRDPRRVLYQTLRQHLDPIRFVVPPLPNTLFTRDTTCWIYGGVSLNPMYWPARRQETLLTTAIYKFHPHSRTPSSSTGSAIPTWTTGRRPSRAAT